MKSLIFKYKNLFLRWYSDLFLFSRGRIISLIKFFYSLLEFPFEFLGDLIFLWKRYLPRRHLIPRKILIVRIDQLGDVLFSTFILPIIKKQYPSAEIDYLVNSKAVTILKNNSYVRNIYTWNKVLFQFIPGRVHVRTGFLNNFVRNIQTALTLRKERYDVIINGRAFLPSSNLMLWFLKSGNLISFDISEQSFFADSWARYDLQEEEWENYMNLLAPLGISKEDGFYNPMFSYFDDSIFDYERLNFLKSHKYIIFAPSSFAKNKQWFLSRWSSLVDFCGEKRFIIVLTGISSQRSYLENIASECSFSDGIIIETELTLPQLGSLYRDSVLFVGVESFPMHLAIALHKPLICLMRNDLYYLKGRSSLKTVGGRSMIPLGMESVYIFDITMSDVEDIKNTISLILK